MDGNKKDDRIEERVELSILYDFYGALLKENQQRMFEACILEDYNFTEIAQEEGIEIVGTHDDFQMIRSADPQNSYGNMRKDLVL